MMWSDVMRVPERRVVRQFGGLCFLALAGFGVHALVARGRTELGLGLIGMGLAVAVFAWFLPRWFRWVYTGAMALAFPIGFTVAQLVLAVLFVGVFLPIGLLLRWRGMDLLQLRRKPEGGSYWREMKTARDPARYLKQY